MTAADDWGEPVRRIPVRPSMAGSNEQLVHAAAIPSFGLDLHRPELQEALEVCGSNRERSCVCVCFGMRLCTCICMYKCECVLCTHVHMCVYVCLGAGICVLQRAGPVVVIKSLRDKGRERDSKVT